MEDIGNSYVNILVWNSLLQMDDGSTDCKMHDLVHDLALDISKNSCLTLYDKEMNDISEVQHLSCIVGEEYNLTLHKTSINRLHTLFYRGKLQGDFLTKFKYLRALSLSKIDIEELSSSIGKLKHLRYLSISSSKIQKLPDSITSLHNLQTLNISDCRNMKEFPNFKNLISLRHLFFMSWPMYPIVGIGQLTSLQTLPYFVVTQVKGCQIQDLKRLNNLRGELKIYGLEAVRCKEEAEEANVFEKSNVHRLELNWISTIREEYNDEEVMEGLKPHCNLKELTIEYFNGERFASWMMNSKLVLNNLVEMSLIYCGRCEVVPALGQLPYLKLLKIQGLQKVKCLGIEFYGDNNGISRGAFPALEQFRLIDMYSLVEWSEVVVTNFMVVFPCLVTLVITDCPNLIYAPGHFPSIKYLNFKRVNNSEAIAEMSRKVTSLTDLEFQGKYEVLNNFLRNNPSLKELQMRGCDDLTSLPDELLQNLASLETLEVVCCRMLMEIPDIQRLTSLKCLIISNCAKLVKFQSGLVYPKSLQEMTIEECPALKFDESCCRSSTTDGEVPTLKSLRIGMFSGDLDYFPWPWPSPLLTLEKLTLSGWSELKSLPPQVQHLPALNYLSLIFFYDLEVLPEWLGSLSSLQTLEISYSEKLAKLPSLEAMRRLTNLHTLIISDVPLLKERCTKGSGLEWPKIAHIPHLYLY